MHDDVRRNDQMILATMDADLIAFVEPQASRRRMWRRELPGARTADNTTAG